MTGKSLNEIITTAGGYTSITNNADNTSSVTWSQDGFSITLLFDSHKKVVKILHQKLK